MEAEAPGLEGAIEDMMVVEVVSKATELCWDKCIISTPGSKFSSSETKCLANCAERFMEACEIIINKIEENDVDVNAVEQTSHPPPCKRSLVPKTICAPSTLPLKTPG